MSAKELNIGDYVRTENGLIAKCIGYKKNNENEYSEYLFDGKIYWYYEYYNEYVYEKDFKEWFDNYVIKSSPNIIDLIEVGDLVKIENEGWVQVSIKFDVLKFFDNSGTEYLYEEIKGIITKEQIASMEYKIGDKE